MHADTGDRPAMCPWRSFADPFVIDVLDAYRWFAKRQLSTWLGADPPRALMQGVLHYDRTLERLAAQKRERDRPKPKK